MFQVGGGPKERAALWRLGRCRGALVLGRGPPPLSGVKPSSPQYEMAPRTFSSLRLIFAFSPLSNSIFAAIADSASLMSAPQAAVPQRRSGTTACQIICGRPVRRDQQRKGLISPLGIPN